MNKLNQPWLGRPFLECVFILAPALLPVIVVYAFQDYFSTHDVSTVWWIILVLCIDVSHVYSTLFRLYWDKKTFKTYKQLLLAIPIAAFVTGFVFHYLNALLFWRILAYIAVYHFIRQQYGFMRLYARKEQHEKWIIMIDTISIYSATLYPLLYWHLHATDKLSWFIKGDFVRFDVPGYEEVFRLFYFLTIAIYLLKEFIISYREKYINIPKNLIIIGTYVSWYVGIVAFQGDLIFSLLNVVAHGVPYMALIWIHGEKKNTTRFTFDLKGVGLFIGLLVSLAYIEENFWDGMVWKDHPEVFPLFSSVNALHDNLWLSILVPLLVLPQITHYILDGFIWRFSKDAQARLE